MMQNTTFDELLSNLRQYKQKYYLNRFVRGLLITLGLVSTVFLTLAVSEHYGRFNSFVRLSFLLVLAASVAYTLISWVGNPIIKLLQLDKALSNEEASRQIGRFFPEIQDKLINTLQLHANLNSTNELILASIKQKTKELNAFTFSGAIDISENRKYFRFVLPPIFLIIILLIILPSILTDSAHRIIKFDRQFVEPAPFQFNILNKNLSAYKNEDVEVMLELAGNEIPDQCYILIHDQRYKLKRKANGIFTYDFKNIQREEIFEFEAAGFKSAAYTLNVQVKPDIKGLEIILHYPAYLKKSSESLKNGGNLTIPEGTTVTWNIETVHTAALSVLFESDKGKEIKAEKDGETFRFLKTIRNDDKYSLLVVNETKLNQSAPIQYSVHVIKDQYPTILVEEFRDSTLLEAIQFGGSLSDDYGINRLEIHFTLKDSNKKALKKGRKNILIESGKTNQTFYFTWNIDSIQIDPGQELEYYLEVFDNDGINGSKSTKSTLFSWKIPSRVELAEEIKTASSSASNQFQEVAEQAKQLQKEMQQLEERLKSKKQLTWQDKKAMEEMVKKNKALEQELEKLRENLKKLQEKQDKFDPASQELAEKMKQLEKLMNELLDEDTKKLMAELEKLLQENAKKEDLDKALKDLTNKDKFLEKELERNLELFKQMQFDRVLENNIQKLDELAKKEEELAEKTLEQKTPKEELGKEQEELNNEFKALKEEIQSLEELNKELENKKPLEDLDQEQQEIDQEMQKSSDELKGNQSKKAGSSQKSAADKMKKMSDKMQQMQQDMQAEEAEENMKDLRQILDNLLHVSFEQETLMKEFRKVQQTDPRYITLGQQQLKLKDDSKIIKDSLYALAKRVPQIEAFVTKEVLAMNQHMDAAVQHIKDRRPDLAASDEQYAMTSMNNLALMLNEVLKQMQQEMASAQPKMGNAQCNKPKPGSSGKPKTGNMSQMQKSLSDKIEQLKKSGLSGKSFSEELAKLAAEQEALRKSLQDMEKMMKEQGGKPGNELKQLGDMMEQTERDLVNKNITNETIMRQREIQTRLLEAEKSVREREWDNTRESKTAGEKPNEYPPSLEKYLKAKEKQLELIKTIPPSYTPYFKEEIDDYFKNLD